MNSALSSNLLTDHAKILIQISEEILPTSPKEIKLLFLYFFHVISRITEPKLQLMSLLTKNNYSQGPL
jgi:hypothetical protein